MTVPTDIGMEQIDASLAGQDDIFDLGLAEKKTRKNVALSTLVGDLENGSDEESDHDDDDRDEDQSDSDLDDKKIERLEDELDGLYDTYKERMNEKDAKFRAKEARKHKNRDEWYGIGSDNGSSDEGDSEEEEEGGWERLQEAKEADADSSSGSDSDESEAEMSETGRETKKRKRALSTTERPKKTRLVSSLQDKKNTRMTDRWFEQEIFKDVGLDEVDDEEDELSENEGSQSNVTEPESYAADEVCPSCNNCSMLRSFNVTYVVG